MNTQEIFALALGLQSPWKINQVSFEEGRTRRTLIIEIDFERGSLFPDEVGEMCRVHDTVKRKWRHLNFFEHECYLHCRVPRIRTSEGNVVQVGVPWARSGSGFTLLFEAFAMHLIEAEMPVSKVGQTLSEYPNRIWTIFNYWIGIAYPRADHHGVRVLGIDETSAKKRHKYVTVAVDLDERRVVHATPGKGSDCIETIQTYLEGKGCPASQIEQVCIDLSTSYISGVTRHFEKAAIVFDRFHIKKALNEAMDQVRKAEREEHEELKYHKYTFLKRNAKLSDEQKAKRDELIELFPTLGQAYRFKELFDDFWDLEDPDDAEAFLNDWCNLVSKSKITPFRDFVKTLRSHWSGVINYIHHRISNGVIEGINSKIQLAKKRARGYRNVENFINMIYFISGKLEFDYPQRSA